jgi:hypothetical protein
MREHAWTEEFAEVPADASPPLYMTPVPADAVGSYAAEPCECCDLTAVEWIEQAERKQLRWWQRLAVTRQLEHRADGSLCHEEILESAPRRSGKSVRLRGVALWRLKHGRALFGEQQTVIHTGSDIPICREIQRGAWRWARDVAGWGVVVANGKEAIETPDDDRWMVKSQDAVYGYDVTLGLVDEGWKVKPDTVTEGLEPAALERQSAQVHLTSTAHRRATSLMRGKIVAGITAAEPEAGKLILIWAAPHGSNPADPEVWRAASPHWSQARRILIEKKYAAALAGEVDPQADDPDPMAGFVAQYLNVWPIRPPDAQRGEPIATEHTWTPLAVAIERDTAPVGAAIESWFKAGVSLALSWSDDQRRALAAVTDHADLAAAVKVLRASGFRGTVAVGKSLADDPALKGIRVRKAEGRAGAAAAELARLMAEDALRFEPQSDESDHLTDQVLAVRIVTGADGPRVVSTGRADAVKALVWAATPARKRRRAGATGMLLPTK